MKFNGFWNFVHFPRKKPTIYGNIIPVMDQNHDAKFPWIF